MRRGGFPGSIDPYRKEETKLITQAVGVAAAAALLVPTAGEVYKITRLFVANTGGTAQAYKLYHDPAGSTFNTTTQLTCSRTVNTGQDHELETEIYVREGEQLAWYGQAGLTITLYGVKRSC